MRITSFPVQESEIEFDFSAAHTCDKHDETNKVLDAVDFILDEPTRSVWLEVKNFEGKSIAPRMRGGARRKFLAKMRVQNGFYRDELRAKFVGTAAFFWLTSVPFSKPVVYVVLLESPRFDSALKLHAKEMMRKLIPTRGSHLAPWAHKVTVAVVDVTEWNLRFPDYPARVL